jgi:hypothetical protein
MTLNSRSRDTQEPRMDRVRIGCRAYSFKRTICSKCFETLVNVHNNHGVFDGEDLPRRDLEYRCCRRCAGHFDRNGHCSQTRALRGSKACGLRSLDASMSKHDSSLSSFRASLGGNGDLLIKGLVDTALEYQNLNIRLLLQVETCNDTELLILEYQVIKMHFFLHGRT